MEIVKDILKVNNEDILSCWRWLIPQVKQVLIVSVIGDLFFVGEDDVVYWLQTDCGAVQKAADKIDEFRELLNNDETIDEWFLPELVKELNQAGMVLKENEVYSYKKPPVLGGEYSVENLQPTDMSVHFAFTGQICEQIKDLPDGATVNIKFEKE